METVQYEYNLSDARLRRRRLRQAVLAFVSAADTSTPSLHVIGIVVPVPSLSTTPFITRVESVASPPQESASSPQVTTQTVDTAKGKDSQRVTRKKRVRGRTAIGDPRTGQTATAKAKKKPSRKTQLMRNRHRQREAAQRACYAATEARLAQARDDARDLQQWLLLTAHTLTVRELSVVVIASLQPRTRKDLALMRLWQLGSEAPRASPLRLADFISISFASEKLLVSWSAAYHKDADGEDGHGDVHHRRHRSGARRTIPPLFNLEDLLLPHQSLLLDLTWCAEAGFHPQNTTPVSDDGRGATASPVLHRPLSLITLAELFVLEVLPTLVFPKGGHRSAGWLSYHAWLHLYGESLQRAAQAHCSGSGVDLGHDDDGNQTDDDRRTHAVTTTPSAAASCAHMRWLFHALYGHPKAVGHRLAWRIGVGYGGTVASLVDSAQQVLVDKPSLARTSASTRGKKKHRNRTLDQGGAAQSPRWCSGLLAVRSLRDVYAVLAVLVAQDQADMYSAAVPVLRGMCRRVRLAHRLRLHEVTAEDMWLRSVPTERALVDARQPKRVKLALARLAARKATSVTGAARAKRKKRKQTKAHDGEHMDARGASAAATSRPTAEVAVVEGGTGKRDTRAFTAVKTTLSDLLRRGRRTLRQRRRALRAACTTRGKDRVDPISLPAATSVKPRQGKRGTTSIDSDARSARKRRRVDSPATGMAAQPMAVERVEPTKLADDAELGWVEDV